ncbi:ABC transporter ATP-binding protein [Georgenia sp. Z1491]|uniref:ABC transporter ATP-binding protein n=1 Tax=Georgenia sp. Z1491 TaxID=3416707 RepID=UPI003CE94D77
MSADQLLEVEDLSITFRLPGEGIGRRRTLHAVRDVSFTIGAGEIFGLVGESGSGKSTTGRAVLRLVDRASGAIRFDGTDISSFGRRTPLKYRSDVQVIFQDPTSSLNPRQTVRESLSQVARRHVSTDAQAVEAAVVEALEHVGLSEHHLDRVPNELSGGQCQRVAIARALIIQPRLVICDEAVSALDVSTQSQVINLLMDLQRETDVAMLFIAHDLTVVKHVSTSVGVMYLGRLVEVGETDEVYARAAHPYTRLLLDSTLTANPKANAAKGGWRPSAGTAREPSDALHTPAGCPFNPRCPLAVDRCREERPEPRPVPGTSQISACHFAEEVARARDLDEAVAMRDAAIVASAPSS